MARYKVTTDDGKSYAVTTDDSSQSNPEISMEGFSRNAIKDYASNAKANLNLAAYGAAPFALSQGHNIYDPKVTSAMGPALWEGVKSIPNNLYESATNPKKWYEQPLTSALDIGTIASGGLQAANLAKKGFTAAAERLAPGIVNRLAGVPEGAVERSVAKPGIFNKPPVPDEQLNEVVGKPIQEAIQQSKKSIGNVFGKIYQRYAGMEGPMQEIVDTPIAQRVNAVEKNIPITNKATIREPNRLTGGYVEKTIDVPGTEVKRSITPGELTTVPRAPRSYEDVLVNKNMAKMAFQNGDTDALKYLYKEYIGTPKSDMTALTITPKDKLQILSRLKRDIQIQTDFNKAPITLAPIDSAKDAALKSMQAEIGDIRTKSNLPGSARLDMVDNAWKSINEIYDTLQKDLSDPGKSRDTMMRLLKGDNTWATSGKMATKVNAIRKVELMTGQKILEPAMEELTRQAFKDWMGKGFVSKFLSGGSLLGAGAAATTNPALLPLAGASLAASSPRVWRGAISGSSKLGNVINTAAQASQIPFTAGLASAFVQNQRKKK